jgi:hypothetical protein
MLHHSFLSRFPVPVRNYIRHSFKVCRLVVQKKFDIVYRRIWLNSQTHQIALTKCTGSQTDFGDVAGIEFSDHTYMIYSSLLQVLPQTSPALLPAKHTRWICDWSKMRRQHLKDFMRFCWIKSCISFSDTGTSRKHHANYGKVASRFRPVAFRPGDGALHQLGRRIQPQQLAHFMCVFQCFLQPPSPRYLTFIS